MRGFLHKIRDWWDRHRPWGGAARHWHPPAEPPRPEVEPRVLEQGLRLLEILREHGTDPAASRFVHLGQGEPPVLPLLWSLAGAPEVVLVEPQRLLDSPLLQATAANLARHAPEIAERLGLERDEVVRRLRCPRDCTFFETLRHFRLQYVAPYDLLRDPLPRREADVLTARSPLDGYSRGYLRSTLVRAATELPDHSRLCLCIDQPQHYEYTSLLQDTGFRLEVDEHQPVLKVVDATDTAPRPDDRLLNSYLVAVPEGKARAQHRQ